MRTGRTYMYSVYLPSCRNTQTKISVRQRHWRLLFSWFDGLSRPIAPHYGINRDLQPQWLAYALRLLLPPTSWMCHWHHFDHLDLLRTYSIRCPCKEGACVGASKVLHFNYKRPSRTRANLKTDCLPQRRWDDARKMGTAAKVCGRWCTYAA